MHPYQRLLIAVPMIAGLLVAGLPAQAEEVTTSDGRTVTYNDMSDDEFVAEDSSFYDPATRAIRCPSTMPDVSERACLRDKYRAGQMGRSNGRHVPERIKDMLVQEYRETHRDSTERAARGWVDDFVAGIKCIGAASHREHCTSGNTADPGVQGDIPWRKIVAVGILCGTGAVVAIEKASPILPRHPVAVMGESVGGCLFGTYVALWGDGRI